jgi:hypothetical protein
MRARRQTWIFVGIGVVAFALSLTFKLKNCGKEQSGDLGNVLLTTSAQESPPVKESELSPPGIGTSFTQVGGGIPSQRQDSALSSSRSRSGSLYGPFASDLPFVMTGEPLFMELVEQIGRNANSPLGEQFMADYSQLLTQPVDSWSIDMENRIANFLRNMPNAANVQASVLCRATGCQILVGEVPVAERGTESAVWRAMQAEEWFFKELTMKSRLPAALGEPLRMLSFKRGATELPRRGSQPVTNSAN